jgi:hypothetical protein
VYTNIKKTVPFFSGKNDRKEREREREREGE